MALNRISLSTSALFVFFGAWVLAAEARTTDDPPSEQVSCGTTATGTATYTQVGRHCTGATDPTTKHQDAVDKANAAFFQWINSTHHCGPCPVGQTGCTESMGTAPTPPFSVADCTFTYQAECQGNPWKTLVIATCTGTVNWGFSCDYCNE